MKVPVSTILVSALSLTTATMTTAPDFKNSFPSIVDFGMVRTITGGTFKQDGKGAWVLRLNAFYNLPFRDANFLYLYGTALLKVGQGGPRIDNPLFLDTYPTLVDRDGARRRLSFVECTEL